VARQREGGYTALLYPTGEVRVGVVVRVGPDHDMT